MPTSDTIHDQEVISRYILTKSWLYGDGRAGCPIRPNALLPHPNIELSVYRIDGWMETEVHSTGHEVANAREVRHREKELAAGRNYPADKRTFRYLGRGDLTARAVRDVHLNVVPKEPPPRHADVVGWPQIAGDRKVDEAAQMAYALKLQRSVKFFPSPAA